MPNASATTCDVAAVPRNWQPPPGEAQAWNELAHVLRWQGSLDEALAAVTRAIELAPELAPAWFNLGASHEARGDSKQALDAYRKAVELDPDYPEAWSNLGGVLGEQGSRSEEIDAYRRAIAINPRLAPVWANLGNALRETGALEEAVRACKHATELDPGFAAAWSNLGSALNDSGRHEEAIEACNTALRLAPDLAEAWNNLGGALRAAGRYDEAIRAHQRAVETGPGDAQAHFNFGVTLQHCGRRDEAVPRFRRALEIQPDHADAHTDLSIALLGSGQFAEGWREYEWRWRRHGAPERRHHFTPWDGDTSRPRRLLLWGEQGIGDQILYASMIADLAASPMHIDVEIDPRLVPLFQRSFPRIAWLQPQDPRSIDRAAYAGQAPLASLGRWLRPSFDAFPGHRGYLKADAGKTKSLAARLRAPGAEKVIGISWASTNREFGDRKSAALTDWIEILRMPGVRFVDLQYGDTGDDRDELRKLHGLEIQHLGEIDLYSDLESLAALCAACDLVITVSNVTAHVAGALGKPVWLLAPLGRGRLWYWFSDRDDSPWYPSMRIFNQRTLGVWQDTLERIARELAGFVGRQR